MSYVIRVPYLPNSFNPKRPEERCWHVETWRRIVANALGHNPKALGFAEIRCVRASCRTMDFDNLVESFRFAINALVRAGVIADDSPAHISVTYLNIKAPKKAGYVSIEITERKVA